MGSGRGKRLLRDDTGFGGTTAAGSTAIQMSMMRDIYFGVGLPSITLRVARLT